MTTVPPIVHVVDDDASFRTAIARLLGASGYQVALYGSASELLEKLPGGAPGCILLDVRMSGLNGPQLDLLRRRYVVLAAGEGAWEDIGESWQMASALGAKEIPNRVDNWGPQWEHDWPTWHRMLPQYLGELT